MNKALKKERGWKQHRYFLLFFGYLLIYHIVIVNHLQLWKLNTVTYSGFCVDYSFGFASKLLPGAVFHLLFGKNATQTTATIYSTVLIVLFFAGLSLWLEKFMLRMPEKHRKKALFLLLFFLSGAYTFAIYTKWVGMNDTAWLFIALLYFVCLENKYLRFFIPLLFVLSLFIHFSALVFVLPMFSLLLLYRASVMESKAEKRATFIIFGVCMLCTAATFALLMLNESHMILPMEEFHQKLDERGMYDYTYIDYSFFHIWHGKQFVPDEVIAMQPSLMKFAKLFYYQVKLVYDLFFESPVNGAVMTVGGTLILLPAVVFFERFHLRRLRGQQNALERFCTFLMMVQFPFIYILGIVFAISVDMTRYLSHGFVVMFACVLCVLYHEEKAQDALFEQAADCNSLAMKIYFLAYATVTFMPSI
ncbi:MAG: hypothetical protein IJI67_05470 [Clostridia bacterium]|nr:hypothetical protein [Clostridia bacterium]